MNDPWGAGYVDPPHITMSDLKTIIGIAVGLTVGIIMVTTAIIPLTSSYVDDGTFTNTGIFDAKTIDATTETVMSFDHTKPTIITVDNVDIDMTNTPSTYGQVTIIFSNDWFARYSLSSKAIALYKCGTNSAAAVAGASESSEKDMTVTISSGTATIVIGDTTLQYDVTGDGAMIVPTGGDYVIKTSSSTCFVNSDSVVYGIGRTDKALGTSGTSFNFMGKASIDDGVTPLYYSPQYTFSETESVNYTKNNHYRDLYELTGFTFNLTSQSVDYPITYNQIFVPKEITAVIDNPDEYKSLVSIIPMMAFIGLIVVAASFAYIKGKN